MNEITKIIQEERKKLDKSIKDKKCPFSGGVKLRGKIFSGIVVSRDTHRTARVEWTRKHFLKKYERSQIKRTKIAVHNPETVNAEIGDLVLIAECRPLSKTKKFIIIKKLAHSKKFMVKKETIEIDKKQLQEAKMKPDHAKKNPVIENESLVEEQTADEDKISEDQQELKTD